MMRQTITRSARQLAQPTRLFSTSVRTMAEGDLGAPRAGGGGDSFNKREAAAENQYVKQQETQKIHLLRQKLQDQKKAIDELEKDLSTLTQEDKSKQ